MIEENICINCNEECESLDSDGLCDECATAFTEHIAECWKSDETKVYDEWFNENYQDIWDNFLVS